MGGLRACALLALLLVVATACGSNPEDGYLEALNTEGLDEWATDTAAINVGKAVCDRFDQGDQPQGTRVAQIAVEHLCPDYAEAFRLLETATIGGSISVGDFESYMMRTIGDDCHGEGGYRDIRAGAAVVVRSSSGAELARSTLGPGELTGLEAVPLACVFDFEVELTEGEDVYLFEIARRGEVAFEWDRMVSDGVALTLG